MSFSANVIINAEDFTQNPFAVRQVAMSPLFSYSTDATHIILGDYKAKPTNAAGSVTFSGVASGLYTLTFFGTSRITPVTINVNQTGDWNAVDLLTVSVSGVNPNTVAYSQAQSDAKYITTGQTGAFGSPANVVYTTGNQNISGAKTLFSDLTMATGRAVIWETETAPIRMYGYYGGIIISGFGSLSSIGGGTVQTDNGFTVGGLNSNGFYAWYNHNTTHTASIGFGDDDVVYSNRPLRLPALNVVKNTTTSDNGEYFSFLQPSLDNANTNAFAFGRSLDGYDCALLSFTPNYGDGISLTSWNLNGDTNGITMQNGNLVGINGTNDGLGYQLQIFGGTQFQGATNFQGNSVFQGGTVSFGNGTVLAVGQGYMVASNSGSNAGFLGNRDVSGNIVSFDLLSDSNPSLGWSMQLQASDANLYIVDRANGNNMVTFGVGGPMNVNTNLTVSGNRVLSLADTGNFTIKNPVNYNAWIANPISGSGVYGTYIGRNFKITGISLGVEVTGTSGTMTCNIYQRSTAGLRTLVSGASIRSGIFHSGYAVNTLATGQNRFSIDLTGAYAGFSGLSIGIFGQEI